MQNNMNITILIVFYKDIYILHLIVLLTKHADVNTIENLISMKKYMIFKKLNSIRIHAHTNIHN